VKTTVILVSIISLEAFLQCSSACSITKVSPLTYYYNWKIFIYSVT